MEGAVRRQRIATLETPWPAPGARPQAIRAESARCDDGHALAGLPVSLELHAAFDQREQREVLALADVAARMDAVADLPNDDAARTDGLAVEHLHAAVLRVRI